MAQYLPLPNGKYFEIREGETPEQALSAAVSQYPEAFGLNTQAEAGPQSGGIAALKAGTSSLKSDIATLLGRTGAIAPETAEKYIEEQKKYQAKTFKPTEEGWTEAPLTKFSELLGGSVPYMAAPLAAGAAAAALPVAAPTAAALGLGAAGLASYGQFTGSFLSRQMETGKKLGETELGTAALAALPAAALDTISLRMIPGIRGILGAAGREVTEAEAKAVAQQNLGRAFGDYVAKAGKTAGVEGLTESAQQVLERMQAGLDITDEAARKEYFDSFLGGAVLGGTLAVPGRALERGKLKGIAEEAETRDKAEARKVAAQTQEAERAAQEARKQDPEYMRQAIAAYDALEKQKAGLQAQIAKAPKGEKLDESQKQANNDIYDQLKALAPELKEAARERNRVMPLLAKAEEGARLAGMSPEEFMLEQTFRAPGMQLPKGGRFATAPEVEEAAPPEPGAIEQYVQQQTDAAKEAGALTLGDRIDYLMASPVMARQIVDMRIPMPDLSKQDTKTVYDALKLQLKEVEKQRVAAGQAATGAAAERLGIVEAEEQAALEESQRQQAALDAETAREKNIAPEILAQRRIAARPAVGVAALINRLPLEGAPAEPAGSSVIGRTAQELRGLPIGAEGEPIYTAEEEKAPAPAPVPQRVKGEFRLFNARGEPQRPSDYNNIQQRLASALARGDIDQDAYDFLRRAEEVLPVYDRKIETARETYAPIGATGEVGVAPQYRKDVTETEGFLTLLDQQLALIEQNKEGTVAPEVATTRPVTYQGFPVRGARAEAAAPTMADLRDIQKNASADPRTLTELQRKQAEAFNRYIGEGKSPAQAAGYAYRDFVAQPEGERVSIAPGEIPKTVRGKESTGQTLSLARPAATTPLSYRQDLEPLLRSAEQMAGPDIAETTQLPLFEEEQAKLGVAFKTPEEFAAFLRSDEANRMRGALLLANKFNSKLAQLPELEIQVAVLAERLDRLFNLRKEIGSLKQLTKNRNTTEMAGRQWEKLSESITKFVVDRMELAGKIEVLTEHKARLEELLKASKMPAMRAQGKVAPAVTATTKLKQDLSSVLKDLQDAQTALGKITATAKRAETMLRVLRAEDRLNELYMGGGEGAALQVLPDSIIDSARQELAAAIAELQPVQEKAAEQRREAAEKAGKERRQQTAVAIAEAEERRVAARKEEQRRLEERFAIEAIKQEVPALTAAQRDARDLPAPTFNVVELDGLEKDPVQVLGGYRSAITSIEKAVRAAQEKSKQARLKQLDAPKAAVEQLEKDYRAAKTADERAALISQIETATAEYAAEAEKLNAQPLTWKGMASQIKTLSTLYNKVDFLEAKIGPNGEFAASVLADKDQFRALLNKEARAAKAKEAKEKKAAKKKEKAQAEAKEAASRVGAPATTGEALTRTEVAQARKQQKTVFGTSTGSAEEATAKEAADIQARAVVAQTIIEIKAKQAKGEELTDLEKSILAQAETKTKTAEKTTGEATTPVKPQLSRGAPVQGGQTVDELEQSLDRALGEKGLAARRIKLFDSVKTFFADLKYKYEYDSADVPADAKAFVDPKTGDVFMFANNIAKNESVGVLLHEVGVHIGFRKLFGVARYQALVQTVKNWATRKDGSLEATIAQRALSRVEAAETSAEQFDDELLAYAVEEAVKAGVEPSALKKGSSLQSWLQVVLDTLRKALSAFGIDANKLTSGDLVNMAYGAAQMEMRGTWHGSDAKFTAFNSKKAGQGEGAFDRRFDYENSLGAGPYTTPQQDYAEYYQYAVPFGKAANSTGYGSMSYQDYRALDEKLQEANATLSPLELEQKFQSRLLTAYLHGVSAGESLDPATNKTTQALLAKLIGAARNPAEKRAVAALDITKIKGLSQRPATGQLYAALDDVPRAQIFEINAMQTLGDRPKVDSLLRKHGDPFDVSQAEQTGQYPGNSLFYRMQRELGIKETVRLFKAAGIRALERNVENGKKIERAYIEQAPDVIPLPEKPIGPAKDLLFSRAPKYESENALTDLADRIIAQPKNFKERMGSNLALEAEMNVADMRAALQESLKRGAKEMGNDDLFTQAMYNVRKADQSMPLVYTALSNGPLEFYTDDKGLRGVKSSNQNNAQEIFNAVKNVPGKNTEAKFALASTYMIAQRAANKGLSKLDIGALGLKESDLAAAMDAVNADPALKSALEEVRRRYNAFNEGQIKFLADAGVISKADAKAWLKDGDYVPYYRVRADGTAELVFGGEKTLTIGDIRTQPYLAELKGGEDKILPLNESIIRNTMLITRAALTNNATKDIAYAMQEFGKGKGETDPITGKAKDTMPIKRGHGPAGADIIRFKQEPDPKDPKDDGKRWQRINTKNTAMEGIPSELVVRSLEGAHLTLPAFLKIGGIAGDWLRKGVTRMPPYIFRQLIRDPMAASFTGGLNYGPFRAVVMAGTEFLRSSVGRSAASKNLIEKGLIQSGVFSGDPDDMSTFATQLASGKDGPAIDRLMGFLDRAAIRADAATRSLVYDNARKNGLSEVEADMMTMESMNFYKRGLSPTVQYANRLIPFMNAQIQGLNVLVKSMRGNMPFEERQRIQRKFWNNAVMLFGVGIVYAMAMDDDETFKNAKPRDKYTNFFVNLPGVSEAIKVPLPYESGWFFSAAVALVDAMKAETDGKQQFKALKDIFLSSVPGYSSVFMPQAVKPLLEVFTNKNFFSGQNIESVAMQGRNPEERFSASTTEAAKALGKVLPLSPIQIEHLARGYFGTAPLALMSVASGLMRGEGKGEAPDRRLSETPILGTVFQKKYGGADADTMYSFAKEATQRAASLKEVQKSGTPADAKEYVASHRTEIAMAPLARNFEMLMSRVRTQEDVVRKRKDLSGEEKRARLDQLDKVKQDLADKFNAAVRRVEAARAS